MHKSAKILGVAGLLLVLALAVFFGIRYGSVPSGEPGTMQAGADGTQQTQESAQEQNDSTEAAAFSPETILAEAGEARAQVRFEDSGVSVTGSGADVSGTKVTIREAGTYAISGSAQEGQICVDAANTDAVVLCLKGLTLSCGDGAVIHVENAKQTLLLLEDETVNRLQSGEQTGLEAVEDTADETLTGGAVYARDDLMISGSGSLQVYGYLNNGIHTTNNLLIDSGRIEITAVNNGLKGKDSVTITGGTFSITCGGDAIKSDDTTGTGYGTVRITGGEFVIESAGDGVQAETTLEIAGGTFQVQSGGGAGNPSGNVGEGGPGGFGGGFGGHTPPDGAEPGDRPDGMDGGRPGGFGGAFGDADSDWDWDTDASGSTKAFKSGTAMDISGGVFQISSAEDAFHTDGSLRITGGEIQIAAGDDGIHAETELTIEGGTIRIDQAYEGIEANQILIRDGDVTVTSSDDGINAFGGQNGFGGSSGTAGKTASLRITGGNVQVQANGDGIDSNGDITIEGGTVVVDGPVNDGNGAIDSGSENGGVCAVNGGTVLAVGSSGMAEGFDSTSTQCSFRYNLSSPVTAGTLIRITDAGGTVLYEHTCAKNVSSVVFSCPDLEQGETYQISAGGETYPITLSSISTSEGVSSGWGWGR